MARKDILPSYLSQQAWRDLCDAIDVVFRTRVDTPTENLGKLRRTHNLNHSGLLKIDNVELLNPATDLDVFESEVLLKQVNSSGLIITSQGYFSTQELARLFRNLPKFWYSKGTEEVVDFLSYVFNIPLTIKKTWTENYSTFLVEGDPGIGTSILSGGTWYPTTHVQVEVEGFSLPGGMPLELFAKIIEELINYPLVPTYVLAIPLLWLTTEAGEYVGIVVGELTYDYEFLGNFAITAPDETSALGGGGFEAITALAIAGAGGSGYTPPSVPVANFSASVTSGASPLTVTFTNTSTGHYSNSSWDFNNDGSIDSIEKDPVHIYNSPGVYTVRMTCANHVGASTKINTGYITVT